MSRELESDAHKLMAGSIAESPSSTYAAQNETAPVAVFKLFAPRTSWSSYALPHADFHISTKEEHTLCGEPPANSKAPISSSESAILTSFGVYTMFTELSRNRHNSLMCRVF